MRVRFHLVNLDQKLVVDRQVANLDRVQEGTTSSNSSIAIPECDPIAKLLCRTGLLQLKLGRPAFAMCAVAGGDPQVRASSVRDNLKFLIFFCTGTFAADLDF
jgi:hypothetical protein